MQYLKDTFVLSLNTCLDRWYSVPEVEAFLLAQEVRIERNHQFVDSAMTYLTLPLLSAQNIHNSFFF